MRGTPSRGISILGQRSITTLRPAASARAAASSLMTPSCIQTALAPTKIAWSTASPAASGRRKMSTMSIGTDRRRGLGVGGDARNAEPGDLDLGAAVHHDLEAGGLGPRRGFLIDDAELHPNRLGADEDRLVDGIAGRLRASKDVDDVDRN